MCLAVPGKILELDGAHARIEYAGGIIRQANVTLVEPKIGDYVIVHAGFAIQIMDEKAAKETMEAWGDFLDTGVAPSE